MYIYKRSEHKYHKPTYPFKFGPWPGCLDSLVGRPVAQGKISKIGTLICRHMEECLKNQKHQNLWSLKNQDQEHTST